MSVYFIASSAITDQAKLDEYVAAAGATLAGQDLKILAATVEAETVEGDPPGPRLVLLEFPDRDAFHKWYDSEKYQAIIGLRHESTKGFAILLDGLG